MVRHIAADMKLQPSAFAQILALLGLRIPVAVIGKILKGKK